MKIRSSIIWLVAVAILLVLAIVWFEKKTTKTSTPVNVSAKTTEAVEATVASTAANLTASTANTLMPAVNQPTNTERKSKEQKMLEGLSTLNDVSIVFYGKVEDQFGSVVTDATVNFGVRVYNGYESTVKSGQTVSDASGLFKISGYKGESLGLGVKKTGYVFVSMNGSGIYSKLYPENERAHPDENNPVIIKMWKLQGAEPLVSLDQKYTLPYNGEPILFDLVARQIVPTGGDLKVIVSRAPGIITQRKENHRTWSIKFIAVNGGLIESDYHAARSVFQAPLDGYQESYQVQMNQDDPAWFDNVQKVFFLTSRNGQVHSKFSLNFGINDDPDGKMRFQLKGVANTNSSRNWEATAPNEN